MLLEKAHAGVVSVVLLNAVDGLHSSLLVLNELPMRLYMRIVRIELGHKSHVSLLLRMEILFAHHCLHFTQLSSLRVVRAY